MKKILLRATCNPLSDASYFETLTQNMLGNNSGNMLFAFSIMKALWTKETQIDLESKFTHSEEEIEIINSEYDAYVISLANAFRPDYIKNLEQMTDTVQKLKIPCIVIGVGLQAAYEPDLNDKRPFDEAAQRFVSAVLEKSVSIGVRGEITAAWLKKHGFSDSGIDVIGCPSVFLYGDELPLRNPGVLTQNSKISVNVSSGMPYKFLRFLERTLPEFPDYYFVPQENKEMALMYAGIPFPQRYKGQQNLFPNDLTRSVYLEDRARFFVNVPSWLEYTRGTDFSFGTRIHGNIAAVLGGAPTFIFAADSRVRELAEYHRIPNMPVSRVSEQTDIRDIYEKTDFAGVQKGHAQRYSHFLDFLDANGLEHLKREEWNDNGPFVEKVSQVSWQGPLHAISCVSKEEQAERLTLYWKYQMEHEENLKAQMQKLREKKEEKQEQQPSGGKNSYLKRALRKLSQI